MLLTGMFAISSGALVGCNDDDDVNKKNSLSVTPASAIEFKAGDNQDVVLTVKTDAKSWAFEKNGEWIVAKQDGDKLTVNAQANREPPMKWRTYPLKASEMTFFSCLVD